LIREEGGLDNQNTIDWLSSIRIIDKQRNHQEDMVVHLNNVGDYRGYRFFQNSFLPVGNARYIKISFEPTTGGPATEARIARSGSTVVRDKDGKEIGPEAEFPGIGKVRYVNFYPDFDLTIRDQRRCRETTTIRPHSSKSPHPTANERCLLRSTLSFPSSI
jgi:hypothetical protein